MVIQIPIQASTYPNSTIERFRKFGSLSMLGKGAGENFDCIKILFSGETPNACDDVARLFNDGND